MSESVGRQRAPSPHLGTAATRLRESARTFKARLNTNHAEEFDQTRRHHVCAELNKLQAQQQETKSLMNLKRMHMFLEGMSSLQNVLTDLRFPDVDDIMACIWGPMRFFFKVTSVDNERALDYILEVYQRLGLQIPPLANYMHFFETSIDSRLCLFHIYQDILEFHALAYKLFSLRTQLWNKLHRSTWKDLDPTFDHLTNTLDIHSRFLASHSEALARTDSGFDFVAPDAADHRFHEYLHGYDAAWSRFRVSEETRKLAQKERVIRWVSAATKTEMLHEGFQQARELCPENGTWLWSRYDEVSNLMFEDPAEYPTVWAHGCRGMGKTILASLLVHRLRTLAERGASIPRGAHVCYFYCQDGDEELATYLGLLRGILHQLVSASVVVNPEGDGTLASMSNANATLLPLCEDKITNSGGSTLSNTEIAASLIESFFEHTPRQYVIIDGLDECSAAIEVQQIVAFLTAQVNRFEGAIDLNQGQLRVLFMSQDTSEVRNAMKKNGVVVGAGEVALEPKVNTEDIRRFVGRKLEPEAGERSRFNLFPSEKQKIENLITAQSEGLFLYAHLAMEYLLKQVTKGDLLAKLEPGMLPRGIEKIYDKLIGTLKKKLTDESPQHWEKAKQLLGWLVCAHRPLKWYEIQAILAFDTDSDTVDFDTRMIRRDNIGDLLGSLVQVLQGDNIRLIHSTAKEHLVKTKHIDAKSVQCDLATLCLRYLSLRCFTADDYREDERRDHIIHGYFSFQDYAVANWYKHIITVIESCYSVFSSSSPDAPSATASFHSALDRFATAYADDLRPFADPSSLPVTSVSVFAPLPFHAVLLRLWSHIYAHQNASAEDRNKTGLARLDISLKSHREVIESDYRPDTTTVGEDTMRDYYGPNLFKCSRTLCKFFHHGFDAKKDRESHQNRHDRPYPCPLATRCGFAPVGFSSNKDQQRHVRNYHPELSDAPSVFEQLSRRVETPKFQCNICQKSFTRNINLKGHERSHFGERPYACSNCGKAFARLNDCRRHERIHTRKGT